jgi:hypothetical protein
MRLTAKKILIVSAQAVVIFVLFLLGMFLGLVVGL